MIEFGKTLREAREAKGYSVSQLAETTRILPQIIENLEREDFTKIVAPIYGRGFVKLYCEAVGIEAKPLVDEFMEIYNGNRPPTIRLKEVGKDDAPQPEPTPATAEPAEPAAPEPPKAEPPAFDFDAMAKPQTPVRTPPKAEPFKPGLNDLPFQDEPPAPKRDYRLPGYSMPEVPRRYWRFGILVAAAVAIVALLAVGTRALYRATMRVPGETQTAQPAAQNAQPETRNQKQETRNAKPAAPREGVEVPPLYID